jgi:RNA polymerase sigma-19 factor, ECF subfamily
MQGETVVGVIYAEHGDWLRNWLHGRTRCLRWAEDLAQDTFCRLLERPEALPIRDPRSFLTVIARRLLIDDVRRRDLERAYVTAHQTLADEIDLLTPERITQAVQLIEGLALLLHDMSVPVRQAFLLRKLDGLTHGEIAVRLGLSDRTVKRHIARAYAHCYALAFPD